MASAHDRDHRGTVSGLKLTGRDSPGGADWQIIRSDGCCRYQGAVYHRDRRRSADHGHQRGLRHGPPEVMEKLARGDNVDPAHYYFRTVMRFETADPRGRLAQPDPAVAKGQREPRASGSKTDCAAGTPTRWNDWQEPGPCSEACALLLACCRAGGSGRHSGLNRPHKRNALDDETIIGIEQFSRSLPVTSAPCCSRAKASIFPPASICRTQGTRRHTRHCSFGLWHRAFEKIQFGKVPAVRCCTARWSGGGLELAAATHVRVAERSAYYALPEGSRGIYVGGGGSVRLPPLIGLRA
jgi:hypothetical protein